MEEQLLVILTEIQSIYKRLPKYLQIRTEKWADKCCLRTSNVVWQKTQLGYARLLLETVRTKVFREPFDRLPPLGPLSPLPGHLSALLRYSPTRNDFKWSKIMKRLDISSSQLRSPRVQQALSGREWDYSVLQGNDVRELNQELTAEEAKTRRLELQLEEFKRRERQQAEELERTKQDLKQLEALHEREIERLKAMHTFQLVKVQQKHEKQLELYATHDRIILKSVASDKSPPPVDDFSAINEYLSYVSQFQSSSAELLASC